MKCVENLKSKSGIQIKVKQILTTNDWVSFKSFPYSNGSWLLLKDMARTKHLYLSVVCRNDEAVLKTSLIQPYSPWLKQQKNKLYHRSWVIRKSWSSERAYATTKEICHLNHSSPMYVSIPRLCYRWWSMAALFFTYTFFLTKHDSVTRRPKESILIGALSRPIIKSNEWIERFKYKSKNV